MIQPDQTLPKPVTFNECLYLEDRNGVFKSPWGHYSKLCQVKCLAGLLLVGERVWSHTGPDDISCDPAPDNQDIND